MSSTNRGAVRSANDFYPTPAPAVWALLERVGRELANYGDRWLEPAIGNGAICKAVDDWGSKNPHLGLRPRWHGIDIEPCEQLIDEPPHWMTGFQYGDFLVCEKLLARYNVIMTNPPFCLAQEFIDRSLGYCPSYSPLVIMLLRLGFLGAKKRSKWWQGREPDAIYVLSERPDFTGQGGDSCDYGWYFWNWHHKGIFVLEGKG